MIGKIFQAVGDRALGLLGRAEAKATGRKVPPRPAQDDDWPEGTEFDAAGRPVFVPASPAELLWNRLTGSSWVSKREWEDDMSQRCGRRVTWEDSGPGVQQ